MKIKNIMKPTFYELYEFIHKQGKKRFGSECKHKNIKNGYCIDCLRKIINRAQP